MSIHDLETIIENTIKGYEAAKRSGNKQEIEWAINDMENVYIMVCNRSVPGTELLRKTILEAREGD